MRRLGVLLALSLVNCQTSPPVSLSTARQPSSQATVSRPELAEIAGQAVSTAGGDRLIFQFLPPAPFRSQTLNPADFAFMRIWVLGYGIAGKMMNEGGYVPINPNQPMTLTVNGVPKGSNRLVVAQMYNAAKDPLAGATLKAVYSSPPKDQNVQVVLKWRFFTAGDVLEKLLSKAPGMAKDLDMAQLQQLIDRLLFGPDPANQNFVVHPSRIDTEAMADFLLQQNGQLPIPQAMPAEWVMPAAQATLFIRDPQGQPYQMGPLLFQVNDPASQPLTLANGVDNGTVSGLTPGSWTVTVAPLNQPNLIVQTTLTVAKDGTVTLAQGSAVNPLVFPNAPTVASILPVQGFNVGDTNITVTGTGFAAGTTVKVGGLAATNLNIVNGTTLTATVPSGLRSGLKAVSVVSAAGISSTLANSFTAQSGIITIAGDGFIDPGDGWTGRFAGDGGPALAASLNYPYTTRTDRFGNLVIGDYYNHRQRVIPTVSGTYYNQAMVAGNIYTIAGSGPTGSNQGSYTGDGGLATAATLHEPDGVSEDSLGNLFFADFRNNVLRKIDTNGLITTIAGAGPPAASGFQGDGGPAANSLLKGPWGIHVDKSNNNLFFSDYSNHCIRMIPAINGNFYGLNGLVAGNIYTIAGTPQSQGFSGDNGQATAAQLNFPWNVALDSAKNLYISDASNHCIRRVAPDGTIATAAGICQNAADGADNVQATTSNLNLPIAVFVDAQDQLYITDVGNNKIRKVAPNGTVTTLAGDGNAGFSGDGGAPTAASLNGPGGVHVAGDGMIYITDAANHRIRKIIP